MNKTTFKINIIDCPSEEQMTSMKLEIFPAIKSLELDITERVF